MPRSAKPLNATQIANAKIKEKMYDLRDGHGLILRVQKSGTKSWLYRYKRPSTGKYTNMPLGNYKVSGKKEIELTLEKAREKRAEANQLLKEDIDPQNYKKNIQGKNNHTLQNVASKWFEVKKKKVTDDYAQDVWRSLELHIFPRLGNIPIQLLTPAQVIESLKALEAKGNLDLVQRICQRINEIMKYAIILQHIEYNIFADINSVFEKPKENHYPTIPPEKLPKLLKSIYNASITQITKNLLLWSLHTVLRPGENAGAMWEEIDFENKMWKIPGERMKMKKAHSVPLTKQTLEILENMKPISEKSRFIFPGARDFNKSTSSSTANMALKRMGYQGLLVAHGIRSLVSTTLNDEDVEIQLGVNSTTIERILSHSEKNEGCGRYTLPI